MLILADLIYLNDWIDGQLSVAEDSQKQDAMESLFYHNEFSLFFVICLLGQMVFNNHTFPKEAQDSIKDRLQKLLITL